MYFSKREFCTQICTVLFSRNKPEQESGWHALENIYPRDAFATGLKNIID